MYQTKTYANCKFFGLPECPNINKEIMKRAAPVLTEHKGGNLKIDLPKPTDEEINAICKDCDKFTQKQP